MFSPETLGLGEIATIGGRCWGSGGCAPSGVQGQSPWSGGLGQSLQKLEAFCCISTLFLSILEYIVELWLLYCISSKSVQVFRSPRGLKFGLSHYFG